MTGGGGGAELAAGLLSDGDRNRQLTSQRTKFSTLLSSRGELIEAAKATDHGAPAARQCERARRLRRQHRGPARSVRQASWSMPASPPRVHGSPRPLQASVPTPSSIWSTPIGTSTTGTATSGCMAKERPSSPMRIPASILPWLSDGKIECVRVIGDLRITGILQLVYDRRHHENEDKKFVLAKITSSLAVRNWSRACAPPRGGRSRDRLATLLEPKYNPPQLNCRPRTLRSFEEGDYGSLAFVRFISRRLCAGSCMTPAIAHRARFAARDRQDDRYVGTAAIGAISGRRKRRRIPQ